MSDRPANRFFGASVACEQVDWGGRADRGESRVHIVGGPGSGKTTLSRLLAVQLRTLAWHLDDIALSEGTFQDFRPRRSLADRVRDVQRLSGESSWVSEGSYLGWTHLLFERAEVILWLDPPWHLAARRIVSRHIQSYFNDVRQKRGLGPRLRALRYPHVFNLVSFFLLASHYYTKGEGREVEDLSPDDMRALTRFATKAYLSRLGDRVVRLTNSDLDCALAALAARPCGVGPSSV